MSRKQEVGQYNKYYHNDIKKQLGVDQTRTASEKLLDRVIKVDKRPDFYLTQNIQQQFNSQPKKKIKANPQTQQTQQTNLQILQSKLFKNIENQLNIIKLLKSLSILKKCLNQQSFMQDSQINFKQNWKIYTTKLINQITQRNYCSSQSFNIMTNIADCIEILFNNFAKNNQSELKSTEKNEQKIENDLNSQNIKTNQEVWTCFCRLFTDDSFIFNRNLNKLKNFIFNQFSGNVLSDSQTKQMVLKLVNKLVSMPVKAQWVHTQLVKLFKEFNNNGYHSQFQQAQQKGYLKSYNQLLNKKPKSSVSVDSYNILGNSKQSKGLNTVYIEASNKSGSDKWVSKQ